MSNFFKKLFGTLSDKPWDKQQMVTDNYHEGKTFNLSNQTSAVIVIFGVSTTLFTLVVTGYLYSIPVGQETDDLTDVLETVDHVIAAPGTAGIAIETATVVWAPSLDRGASANARIGRETVTAIVIGGERRHRPRAIVARGTKFGEFEPGSASRPQH